MLQNTDSKNGFTLIELIVAIGIFGALSLVSVQMLWDTISSRSKQNSIENVSSTIRPILATLAQAIESASQISITGSQIKITGFPCRTIDLYDYRIWQSIDSSPTCNPPASGTDPLTPLPPTFSVSEFTLTTPSTLNVINITIGVTYKDSLGSHTLYATTSAVKRATIQL
jgi:prepilin-type N-terminal cleavage/methylation domain-containing protein